VASFAPSELLLSPRAPSPAGLSRSLSVSALHVSNDEECPAQILRYFNAWSEEDDDGGDSFLYIQTELCDGTLEDAALANNAHRALRFPDERAVARLLRHILFGLKYLHTRGLVHLDLKPSNIFVRRDTYKIGDLGHITAQSAVGGGTASPRIVSEGDSCYMPKELMEFDHARLDLTKADIFSLGASIFEVVSGKRLTKSGKEWHDIRSGVLVFDRSKAHEAGDMAAATAKTPAASPRAQGCLQVPTGGGGMKEGEGREEGVEGGNEPAMLWSSKVDMVAFAASNESLQMLHPIRVSPPFQGMLRSMMHPDPGQRPSAQALLLNPLLQTDTEKRLARAEALLRTAQNDLRRRAIDNVRNGGTGNIPHGFPMRGQSNGGVEESGQAKSLSLLNKSGRMQRANTM
jgi:serine/threonine protein kinase